MDLFNKVPIIITTALMVSFAFDEIALATDAYTSTLHQESYPTYPTVNYGTGKKAEQIKRGEYLVKMGDCIACHTAPKGGKPFAGGYPVKTPFGTIYTPNITPDKKTGIGKWSDADFIRAMREGISPEGHYYYPAFPYPYFNKVTTPDLLAIRAYLNAIPAIKQKNKDSDLMFPFNWRFLQLGWRTLFFHFQQTGPYQPNPNKSDAWNRGNYLVNGLGHCGMCHTPSYYLISKKYLLGAPIKKYALAGSMVDGFYAPNITSTLLKKTTLQEFADVFLKDKLIGGGQVEGPMKDANHDSLKYLTMDDIKAIDTYLLSVKSKTPPKPSHSHQSGLEQGKDIYNTYCTGCHTTGAGGAPKLGDVAEWQPLLKQGLNSLYKNAINGIKGMPPKGTCMNCTNQEIQYAVNYIVSTVKPGAKGVKTAEKPKPIKQLTIEDGKKIYDQHCASCHNPDTSIVAPKLGDEATWKPIIAQGVDVAIVNTIRGKGKMPPRGGCKTCDDAQLKAAVKYMIQNSQTGKDYRLW